MLLELNENFQGYLVEECLSIQNDLREVYKVVDVKGEYFALTVYNINAIPDGYDKDYIPELELYPRFVTDVFPTFRDKGVYETDDVSYRWMITEFIDGVKLSDIMDELREKPVNILLRSFYDMLIGIKEISWLTNGGSHNNINLDNIIVMKYGTDNYKWYLTGCGSISEPCTGKLPFVMNQLCAFRAPEMLVGRTSFKSDIFSLGILLAILMQGKHPWGVDWRENSGISLSEIVTLMRKDSPDLCESGSLSFIIKGAIGILPSGRWKTLEKMGRLVATCFKSSELVKSMECFINEKCMPDEDVMRTDDIPSSVDNKEAGENIDEELDDCPTGQLRANIQFERCKGNGFCDVAGMDDVKSKLLRDFVEIVKRKDLAEQFKVKASNCIFHGPPGVGKSFIAKKLAEESGMISCVINPSDLGNIYIHGSQNLIADVFLRSEALAKKYNNAVLLIFEEFDSMVPKRNGNDSTSQCNEVAEFLARLNNCTEKNVFVVATTNRIDSIDEAVTRKGRFGAVIYIGLPDNKARKELICLELDKRPYSKVKIERLVALTEGYSCSDISFIIEESAKRAFEMSLNKKRIKKISQSIIESVIADTKPSVSRNELKRYERSRDDIMQVSRPSHRRIGFTA